MFKLSDIVYRFPLLISNNKSIVINSFCISLPLTIGRIRHIVNNAKNSNIANKRQRFPPIRYNLMIKRDRSLNQQKCRCKQQSDTDLFSSILNQAQNRRPTELKIHAIAPKYTIPLKLNIELLLI